MLNQENLVQVVYQIWELTMNKLKYKILIILFALISVFVIKEINDKIQYYNDVKRFDQIKDILMKGQKVDL